MTHARRQSIRRIWRRQNQINHPRRIEHAGVVNQGIRFRHEDSYRRWVILDRSQFTLASIGRFIEEFFPEAHGYPVYSDYDCTGRWFSYRMKVHIGNHRVLLAQDWYCDV